MTLLAKMYREWANLDAAMATGEAFWIKPRRLRVGCLICALELRQAKRGAK